MEIRNRLTRFFETRVGSKEDAEDLAQDVLLRAHRAQTQLQEDEKFESWLFAIARNALTDHYRKAGRHREKFVPLPDGDGAMDFGAEMQPEATVLEELAGCVRPMMEKLRADDRALLEAVDMGDESQVAAADRLGLSRSGAKSRVQRARQRLLQEFVTCCGVEADSPTTTANVHAHACDCQPSPREI